MAKGHGQWKLKCEGRFLGHTFVVSGSININPKSKLFLAYNTRTTTSRSS